jgi:predicted nucleic acid-binding Zn ribbon protein
MEPTDSESFKKPSTRPLRSSRRQKKGPRQKPSSQEVITRRIGNLSVLIPPPRPPATGLDRCLASLEHEWQRQGNLAALWQRWPTLAGTQLAPHCRPLRLQGSVLCVGASPGPWLQALQYHRHQLLGSLRSAGFAIRDLRVVQYHPSPLATSGMQLEWQSWEQHPSRVDVHGLANCPRCGSPAPMGEMARWNHCSFCQRQALAVAQSNGGSQSQ